VTTLKVAEEVCTYITQTNIIYKWQYTVPHHPYSTVLQLYNVCSTQTHMYSMIIEKKSCSVCATVAVHPQVYFFLKAAQQFLLSRSVTDLARLSLEQPVFVSVHENASHTTPDTLTQSYIVTDLQHKVNITRKVSFCHFCLPGVAKCYPLEREGIID
jgi:hypothetical protein